jgi:hypothetical protein
MRLLSAQYGLPTNWMNVTHKMSRFIQPTRVLISSSTNINHIFGDPCNGKRKILRLILQKGNNKYEIDLEEERSRLKKTFDTDQFNFDQAKLLLLEPPDLVDVVDPADSSSIHIQKKKIRLLLMDCLFPTTHGHWRTVEINYFLSNPSYETDVLLSPFLIDTVRDLKETLNSIFETYYSQYTHLNNYNIFIFDKQFNELNKYNKNGFNGIIYNGAANGSFLLSRSNELNLKCYDVAYSIFLGVQMFNMDITAKLWWPSVCKVYAGGGFGLHHVSQMSNDFGKLKSAGACVIACQDFISKSARIYIDNVEEVYGGPLIEPGQKPAFKNIGKRDTLNLCFTSAIYEPKKGFDDYLRLAESFQELKQVTFFVVGLQPQYRVIMPNIVYYNIMRPNDLFKFYRESVDIIVSPIKAVEKYSPDGFPIGGEAMIQGCIPIHCDPYNANDFFGFTRREGLFIPCFDLQLVREFVLDLLHDPMKMQNMSNATVNKMFKLYGPEKQLVPVDKILKRVVAKTKSLALLDRAVYDYDKEEIKSQCDYIIDLVINHNLKFMMDLAVWRGHAIIPMIMASHIIGGKVIGLERDSTNLIVVGDLPEVLCKKFVAYQKDACAEIKKDRTILLSNQDTNDYVIYPVEMYKNEKWDESHSLELLYINCYHVDPTEELYNYLNRVKAGGFIIMHGIHLSHAKKALSLLELFGVRDQINGTVWAVWKRNLKKATYDTSASLLIETPKTYFYQQDKTFAIIIPYIDSELNYFRHMLDSLSQQLYTKWILYVVTQGASELVIQKLTELVRNIDQDKIYMINMPQDSSIVGEQVPIDPSIPQGGSSVTIFNHSVKKAKQNLHRYAVIFNPNGYCDKFFLWLQMNLYESYPASEIIFSPLGADVQVLSTFELKKINYLQMDHEIKNQTLYTASLRFLESTEVKDYVAAAVSLPTTIITRRQFKYTIAICSIFKNEAKYLKEWLEYHLLIGVEHFYLFDNLSTDDSVAVLATYIERGLVTLSTYEFDYRYADFSNQNSNGWTHLKGPQFPYSKVVNQYKDESEFIAFIDLDEFIKTARNVPLTVLMRKYEAYGGLAMHWLCIGSTNHYVEPEGLVLENYFLRPSKNHSYNIWVKSIINPRKFVSWQDVHLPIMTQPIVRYDFSVCAVRWHEQPIHQDICLYHYRTKSQEYYFLTKMARILPSNYSLKDLMGFTVTSNDPKEYKGTILKLFYSNKLEWYNCNKLDFNYIEEHGMWEVLPILRRNLGLRPKSVEPKIGNVPVLFEEDQKFNTYRSSQKGLSYHNLLSEYWLIEGKCPSVNFRAVEDVVKKEEFLIYKNNPNIKQILTNYLKNTAKQEEWRVTDNMIYQYLIENNGFSYMS